MNIEQAQPGQMRALWPHVEGYFASFEKRSKGELLAAELLYQVMRGTRQCWVATDGEEVKACALTEIQEGPLQTVTLNFCAGVDREEWYREMVGEIERWASANGSRRVRMVARMGWEPSLRELGYRKTHVVMERDL